MLPAAPRAHDSARPCDRTDRAIAAGDLFIAELEVAVSADRNPSHLQLERFQSQYARLTSLGRALIGKIVPVPVEPVRFRRSDYALMSVYLRKRPMSFWSLWRRLRRQSLADAAKIAKREAEAGHWFRAQMTRLIVTCNLVELAALGIMACLHIPIRGVDNTVRRIAAVIAVVEIGDHALAQ
jgi:hypothetical protein